MTTSELTKLVKLTKKAALLVLAREFNMKEVMKIFKMRLQRFASKKRLCLKINKIRKVTVTPQMMRILTTNQP
jgi:hypothetical protein